VLLGDQEKFNDIVDVIPLDYTAEIQDAWVKQKRKGSVYATKNENNELMIISPVCTHLGCNVAFRPPGENSETDLRFKCPCHGGEFDRMGKNIGGPPPRPLDIFQPVVREGKVYINLLAPITRR
ncbi:MAG TPA: ubiquinol-cytochrome c reductase iron-sulfur subunit, partial [Bacilli bacterium]